jgi:hypothetical protein
LKVANFTETSDDFIEDRKNGFCNFEFANSWKTDQLLGWAAGFIYAIGVTGKIKIKALLKNEI